MRTRAMVTLLATLAAAAPALGAQGHPQARRPAAAAPADSSRPTRARGKGREAKGSNRPRHTRRK